MRLQVGLKENFGNKAVDPSYLVRMQIEQLLQRHPRVLRKVIEKAISEAPDVVETQAEVVVEEVKQEVV